MILLPDYLIRIWDHLSKNRKVQVLLTIFIMLLAAVSESLSLVSVVPFLRVILNQSYNYYLYNKYLSTISFVNENNFKLFITLSFIFFILIFSLLRLYTLWRNNKISGLIHLARAVNRRAEISIVKLSEKKKINMEVLKYINRLSDLLFVLARQTNKKEILWYPLKNK